jgi:hypothetical protein
MREDPVPILVDRLVRKIGREKYRSTTARRVPVTCQFRG